MLAFAELHVGMSVEQLEAEKHARDAERERLAAEMLTIHRWLEPKWDAQNESKAGPRRLTQSVQFGALSLGGMTAEQLEKHLSEVQSELQKKRGQ